jgi:hypothetical protein
MMLLRQDAWGKLLVGAFLGMGAFVASEATAFAQQEAAANQPAHPATDQVRDPKGILDLDLEQLAKTPVVIPSMDIPLTSVTKEQSTVGCSAAVAWRH